MGIETLIGGGLSLLGGVLGGNASKKAAKTQADSADRATDLQRDIYNQQREDNAPWQEGGQNALMRLLSDTGVSGDPNAQGYGNLMSPFSMQRDYQEDPGYQFRLGEGTKAIQRGAAAMGGIGSGKYLKDLTRFGQGEASQEYGNAWNRWNTGQNQRFNRLASIAGVGQTANSQVANAGQTFGTQAGQNIVGAGNARASGYVGGANAVNGAIGQGWNMYQGNRMMNMLNQPQSGGGGIGSPYAGQVPTDYGQYF